MHGVHEFTCLEIQYGWPACLLQVCQQAESRDTLAWPGWEAEGATAAYAVLYYTRVHIAHLYTISLFEGCIAAELIQLVLVADLLAKALSWWWGWPANCKHYPTVRLSPLD
jgi:hypothetical protein